MTDLTQLLKDADPLRDPAADDASLSAADAQTIRREMLAAIPESAGLFPAWQRPMVVAALTALMIAVAGVAGHRAPPASSETDTTRSLVPAGSSGELDCRQLQFATPGGTRIIWIFDQSLRLQESMP
jgi:hypothetical protein